MGAIDDLIESEAWRSVLERPAAVAGAGGVRRPPLLPAPSLAVTAGAAEAHVKAEGLQRTGSFKLRGATARLTAMPPEETRPGVVTASAGNHGLGVAEAGRRLGIRATVVVPATSPEVKRRGVQALGAEVVVAGKGYDQAEDAARGLARERGATFVSGFDDEHVMAGNGGTLAREIEAALGGVGPDDVVVVPVGGGGLVSGVLGALHGSGATVIGVEPRVNRAMSVSLERGSALVGNPEGRPTLAEALEGGVAERTFAICREGLAGMALVSEEGVRRAIAWGFRRLGLILEPSAAVGLAAVLDGEVGAAGRRLTCILTGSNVDPDLLDAILREEQA